jgi:hemerythrin
MSVQWIDSLTIGIEEIDNQQKSIIEQFSGLSEAAQSGVGKALIEVLLFFLPDYVHVHFSAEEK